MLVGVEHIDVEDDDVVLLLLLLLDEYVQFDFVFVVVVVVDVDVDGGLVDIISTCVGLLLGINRFMFAFKFIYLFISHLKYLDDKK